LLCNVLVSNKNVDRVRRLIDTSGPDLVALLEVNTEWLETLDLTEDYPYAVAEPQDDSFGIALFSRLPLRGPRIVYFGNTVVPSIIAEIQAEGRGIVFIVTHPLPPKDKTYTAYRNKQLAGIGRFVGTQSLPCVLAGDLNVTMWAPEYARFERESGLVNARKGFGILPTFPALIYPAAVPIDHVLCDPDIAVGDCRLGPRVGSDHLPLIVDLVVPAPGPAPR
jgi:endonuclease/exonuclease/phosphatase (EEP) superfamily protein YafD